MPKQFVFVLMPFDKKFNNVYKVGIIPACKDAGAYCERIDEQIFVESILERIYNQIAKADIIISDMTGRNPNVFYETGYAHALGKQVILLTQQAEDIPFDLKHYPHIIYGDEIYVLKDELERRVRWCIENPQRLLAGVDWDLEFYLKGQRLTDNKLVGFKLKKLSQGTTLRFLLDIHNPSNKVYDASSIEIGVILPMGFETGLNVSTVRLPGKQCMHILTNLGRILPDGWKPVPLEIRIDEVEEIRGREFDCFLRVFSEIGTRDIPFKIRISRTV